MTRPDRDLDVQNLLDLLWMARLMRGAPGDAATVPAGIDGDEDTTAPNSEAVPEPTTGETTPPPSGGASPVPPRPPVPAPATITGSVVIPSPAAAGGGVAGGGRRVGLRRPAPATETTVTSRSLRPLRRRVPRPGRIVLDEEATARASAETGWPIVVTRAHTERWLDLALVVDDSPSMVLWRETVDTFQRVMRRAGVFRDVRVWRLTADGPDGSPTLVTAAGRVHKPSELHDPVGRRLIALVTDGIDDRWRRGATAEMLQRWSADNPVVTFQALPKSLWRRTALPPESALPRQHRPGIWRSAPPDTSVDGAWVPVIPIDDGDIRRWITTMVSLRPAAAPMDFLPVGYLPLSDESDDVYGDYDLVPESPVERVAGFRAEVTPTAFDLARHLAAVPVTLPVARAVQRAWLPESDRGHLVEVLFSGLLERAAPPVDDPDEVLYEFLPGVRHELLRTNDREQTFKILGRLAEDAESLPTRRFGTVDLFELAEAPGGYLAEFPDSRLLAEVAVAVLGGFGGVLADAATRLETVLHDSAPELHQTTVVNEPLPDLLTEVPPALVAGMAILDPLVAAPLFQESLPFTFSRTWDMPQNAFTRLVIDAPVLPEQDSARLRESGALLALSEVRTARPVTGYLTVESRTEWQHRHGVAGQGTASMIIHFKGVYKY
ncbi:hypothetical protein KZ829_25985 [Actinoplanes hulinensis]|uniref:Uncharacterized protein n=1 Tax=Actinoplanes hulinensis TaxID=1144547 RepID=A0ABS7B867_9ACTN|nr:SAV_2336 N-terminal domain-related protein [Actinoplanes hulinensis]MBW6437190.1 hypothetical protein [Actinoplanes hulinensis]